MEWREKEASVSRKTIRKIVLSITLIPLKELKAKDLIIYFRNITMGRQITRKRFNDLKTL